MEETHAEENARLLAPYIVRRNELAHEVLSKLLDGQYLASTDLLAEYHLSCIAVDSAMTICQWFDDGVASDHIEIVDDQGPAGAPSSGKETKHHP